MADLNDGVVVITGAGSGMGEAMAHAFADAGSAVVVLDINAEGVERVVADVQAHGKEAMPAVVDITDSAAVSRCIDDVIARYGKLDVLCNNAAVFDWMRPVTEVTESFWNHVIGVNLTAPYLVSRSALEVMLPRKQGAIINTSSLGGLSGGLGGAAYVSSKWGIIGLSKNIAYQYGREGIRCNVICPGSVETPMSKSRQEGELSELGWASAEPLFGGRIRTGDPSEIASVAVFLASDAASLVNGAVITADAGWSAG